MKKFIIMIFIGVILFLSGCASADDIAQDIYDHSIYDNLIYDFDSMSFTNTSESDIIYLNGSQYLDFLYVYDLLITENLTVGEIDAYHNVFTIIDTIIDNNNILINNILSYSSSEFNDAAGESQIELGLEDIVIFNTLKLRIIELEELSGSSNILITKLEYIEYILDIDLTSDEIDSLEFLQELYGELYGKTNDLFDIGENTLEDLLELFSDRFMYIPTESELIELELGYNIILEVINK